MLILGLYKCNYSLTVKQELGAAAGLETRWRAGFSWKARFGPLALSLPPVPYKVHTVTISLVGKVRLRLDEYYNNVTML